MTRQRLERRCGTAVPALVMAALFKRTLLRGTTRPLIVELPPYRLPDPRSLAISVWHRAMLFLKKAGTVILAFSMLALAYGSAWVIYRGGLALGLG